MSQRHRAIGEALILSGGYVTTESIPDDFTCWGCQLILRAAMHAGGVIVPVNGRRVHVSVCQTCYKACKPKYRDEGGPSAGWVNGTLRPDLPPLPDRVKRLPVDARGYPVPFFVAWIDGRPEFRTMSARKLLVAILGRKCWVCGDPLGSLVAFVVGPMCVVNRTNGEPPSHRECAEFSARACPFLTKPHMSRREGGMPEPAEPGAGHMIRRNPGVVAVYVTRTYTRFNDDRGKPLLNMGEPVECHWYAEGRPATRREVVASIDSGIPELQNLCRGDDDFRTLAYMLARAKPLLPPAPPADPVTADPAVMMGDDGCPNDEPAG